jgi:hypothetical protein
MPQKINNRVPQTEAAVVKSCGFAAYSAVRNGSHAVGVCCERDMAWELPLRPFPRP